MKYSLSRVHPVNRILYGLTGGMLAFVFFAGVMRLSPSVAMWGFILIFLYSLWLMITGAVKHWFNFWGDKEYRKDSGVLGYLLMILTLSYLFYLLYSSRGLLADSWSNYQDALDPVVRINDFSSFVEALKNMEGFLRIPF